MMPGYPCPVCARAGGAVTVQRAGAKPAMVQYCSTECAVQHLRKPDLMPDEKAAVAAGGEAAGAYLDRIGKTDLATLTEAQWGEFCGTLFKATCAAMRAAADDEIPF
jgi:hypothetical protein